MKPLADNGVDWKQIATDAIRQQAIVHKVTTSSGLASCVNNSMAETHTAPCRDESAPCQSNVPRAAVT